MSLAKQLAAVGALFERYDNVPASLADASPVRMSELYEPCSKLRPPQLEVAGYRLTYASPLIGLAHVDGSRKT
jgi:hypothetical protein